MSTRAMQATRLDTRQSTAGVDPMLLGAFLSLLALGLVMVFSTTIAMGEQDLAVNTSHLWRNIIHIAVGLTLLIVIANLPVWLWQKLSVPILIVTITSLVLVLVFGIEVNGAKRWFSIGGFRMQPAEFAKLAVILYAASYLTRHQVHIKQFSKGIVNMGLVLAIMGSLLLLQPDFGTFVVMSATVGLMMFLGGIRISHTILVFVALAGVMRLLVMTAPYRMNRWMSFLDPWQDPFGSGFQLTQALIAVGRGEILGVGLGASIQKLFYLPHANNDFILAVIGEELGLLGVLLVIILFAILLYRALRISRTAELLGRVYAARLAQGVGFLLVFQAVINIGVNLGALPTKGLTLPFISYGGSSMLSCCIAMGLLIAVDRQNRQRELKSLKPTRRTSSRSKQGGAHA